MPAGNGHEKTKGMSLYFLSAIKKNIVVKAEFLCLAYALILAKARVNGYSKYKSYRNGSCLHKPIEEFLIASVVTLRNGGGFQELWQFQEYLSN